jgi:hypothetical protein
MNSEFQDAVSVEGMDEARTNIRAWLKMVSKGSEFEGDIPLELCNVGAGAEVVYTTEWDITEPVDNIIDELMEHAEEDALAVGRGTVRFKVVVEGMKKAGRAAFTLRVPNNGDIDSDDIEDIDEAASRKGLLTQLMRHQEKVMKVGLGGAAKAQDTLAKQLDTANKRNQELEARYMENVKTYEELLSGRHLRDLELRKLDNSERRNEQVAGMLLQGMPLLLNKFLAPKAPGLPAGAGGQVEASKPFAEEVTPLEHMLEGFLISFTQEQLQTIMRAQLFTPPQLMAFMEIARIVQGRMEAREAKQRGQNPHSATNGTAPQPGTPSPA